MIYELTEIDYDILNSIYFVEPFEKILEEVNYPPNVVADCLKSLIAKKYVVAMLWDDTKQDYVRSFMYDSDNMNAYSYLATKDGLLAHNSQV
ncbi:MAG: hypothetical protein EBZ58_08050 [Bacteroidetes bacterium]|nr:hypothetical protein [Bacteroidota bacterium]